MTERPNQAMQLTASKPALYPWVSAVESIYCAACTEDSRQLILCLVRPMKALFFIAFATLATLLCATATTVEQKSLEELVALADNIWGGEVTSVRMIDASGREISNADAKTGPFRSNTILLDVTVDRARILKSTPRELPQTISIPLWQMWHYSLRKIKKMEGSKFLFFLSKDLKPAYPAGFQLPLEEESKIKKLIEETR